MSEYSVSKRFVWRGVITEMVASVMRMFGLTAERLNDEAVVHECQLAIDDGDVVYITGASGAGKSCLLRELEKGKGCHNWTEEYDMRVNCRSIYLLCPYNAFVVENG